MMREIAEQSEYYARLGAQVIEEHPRDLGWIPDNVSIGYLESDKPKKKDGKYILGECIRVRDLFKAYIPHDFVIAIYLPNVVGMSEEQLKILMYHELLHVGMEQDGSGPKYIVNPHDIEDFRTIIEKYGMDWAEH